MGSPSHPEKQSWGKPGIGGSSRSCLYEKHDIVSFFLCKRSLLVLRMASCHAVLGSRGSAEARGALGFFDLLGNVLP
jgi:hypothetical protein